MRRDHPIFKGPLDPKLELEEISTPENYRGYPGGNDLPAKLEAWRVQAGKWPEEIDVGLVSTPWGFEDSPDAEAISGGSNSKGPTSVALGRHGNWFLWGFAGDPKQMTESGRRVFINAVCWMKRFDGRKPLVERLRTSREAIPLYVRYALKYEKIQEQEWFRNTFGVEVRERTGLEAGKLEAWYLENAEIVRSDGSGFVADPDVKALGVSNRKLEFVDALAARLGKDGKDALALRLAGRYLPGAPAEAGALKAWVAENRAFLFFSDVGGFRWFVDENAKKK